MTRTRLLIAACALMVALPARADTEAAARRLEAVRTFADQVLEQGRDRYSGKDTPLFVDGVNTQTGEPVTWVFRGMRYIVSNLASQQNLFRTLDLLSRATDEPRYRDAAKAAIRYHFDHLASRCGLLRWGGHQFIDLATLEPVGKFDANCHELKHSYPYYELMHEVDPDATTRYLRAFWNAHVIDWSRLDMNRHGPYGKRMGKLWDHAFDPPDPFFEGKGLTFINCGTDLIHAAGMLYRLSGEAGALTWAERLAGQYVRARHPETGLGVYQYSKAERRLPPPPVMRETRDTWSTYGDRAENQFGAEFGETAREGYAMWGGRPASIYVNNALVQLALAETLGERGAKLRDWTVDGMKAYVRQAYDPETNVFRPMWADGTDLTGFRFPRFGYFGDEGTTLSPAGADAGFLASYARACRLTRDPELWETLRHMARGNGLGELGTEPGAAPDLNLATTADDPELLFAVLEICRVAQHPAYLELAERIGGNIVAQQVHGGWFLPSPDRLHANFNEIAPLALLHLDAAVRGRIAELPPYVPSRGYIHGQYDGFGRTTDATAIWAVKR